MKILILGAGATGQVFGRALIRAKANVSFFVREKHLDDIKNGYQICDYHGRTLSSPETIKDYSIYTQFDEVKDIAWDCVILSISSPALRSHEVSELLKVTVRPETAVVSIPPGIEDDEHLATLIPKDQIVSLTVSFAAFRVPDGLAVFHPAISIARISSESKQLRAIAGLLNQGRIRTKISRNARYDLAIPDAFLVVFIYCLEKSNWSLAALLANTSLLNQMNQAIIEAVKATSKKTGHSAVYAVLAHRFVFRFALKTACKLLPFDLEAMLKNHFSRHTEQTRQKMLNFKALCRIYGISTKALDALSKV